MKPEKGVIRLLILAETVLLVTTCVLGVVREFRTPKSESAYQAETAEAVENEKEIETEIETVFYEESEAQVRFSTEVEAKLAEMTLEEKVAQMFLTTPESLTQMEQVNIAGAGTKSAINEYPVGGLIYSTVNYQGREQMQKLTYNAEQIMNERMGLYLFLAARLDDADGTQVVGISDNYEPDAIVETFVQKQLQTDSEGMASPCRFPSGQAELNESTAWVMLEAVADATVTGEEGLPCALSAECVKAVRQAGYQGVILTDSLSADGIKNTYSVEEAAVQAVQAGVDMVYCPEEFPDAYRAVLEAVQAGEITEECINQAVGRILTKKYEIPVPVEEEPEAEAESTTNNNTTADEQQEVIDNVDGEQ